MFAEFCRFLNRFAVANLVKGTYNNVNIIIVVLHRPLRAHLESGTRKT